MAEVSLAERSAIYRRGLTIRACAAGAFLVFFALWRVVGSEHGIRRYDLLLITILALIVINGPLLWLGRRRRFPLSDFYLHWVIDVTGVTIVIYCLGTLDISLAAAAYMVMIVSSATFATSEAPFMVAGMSAVAYAALVAAERSGMVPHQHVGLDTHAGVEAAAFFVGGGVVFFYVFAYLAQTLASQLRDTAAEIERQRRELAESYEKEQLARDGMILLSRLVQHDVYSPLGVVSAACEEVRARCEDEDWEGTRHYISIIGSRLRSIESAVTSLSMFGEAEANEYGPPSDLHDVVSELVRDLEAESRERAVTVQVSGDWPRIAKARSQVYHVIRNLLTNAIKCVDDDGTGRVDLIGERLTDNAGGWVVRVLDNGPGVSGEVLHRLQSRALPVLGAGRAGGGFGAGLLLSHNLAAGWGGSLTYEDAPERGSVFTITLPSEVLAE